jgi:predicted ATPase
MPEHRYQTCEGLLSDWKDIQQNPDDWFTAGKADQASRFMIPQGLYGRDAEMEVLRDFYLRTHEEKWSDLVFLKGYAGVGKTALVRELSGMMQSTRTIFCQGKFDQNQSIPFSAIRQALGSLTRQILAEPATRLAQWRNSILSALNEEIAVLLPLIPDVAHILAVQLPPPLANLEDPTSQVERQKRVLIQFLRVFAERKTLVIFLDDLQWSSQSDLQLLASLVQEFPLLQSESHSPFSGSLSSTLLICAYRDSVVGPTHPIHTIFEDRISSHTIHVYPLKQEDAARLVCDTLHRPPEECEELTRILVSRSRGNPFFIQRVFIHT